MSNYNPQNRIGLKVRITWGTKSVYEIVEVDSLDDNIVYISNGSGNSLKTEFTQLVVLTEKEAK